jgi:nucleoside-diphosphate-sugar epimerase
MKRVLVTGGAGFIGSHLVRALRVQGAPVRVLDNLSSGRLVNLRGLDAEVEFIEGDIRDAALCRAACEGVDTVFHLAALVSVPQSVADPALSDAINTGGTLNLLQAARDRRARRFVFSSSSAVYGDTDVIPTHEEVLPRPTSPYGVQKLTGEHYARTFTRLFDLETVCLRYFNVYGPGQNPHSEYAAVIPKFLARLVAGEAPTVYGDGEQTRDFCYVGDVVAANLLAARTGNAEAIGNVFNIAGGVQTSLNDLLSRLRAATKVDRDACYAPARAGDIRHSGADIRRAREILGFAPRFSLPDGLRACGESPLRPQSPAGG